MTTVKLLFVCSFLILTKGDGRNCNCENDLMDCANRGKSGLLPNEICRNTKRVDLSSNMFRTFPDGLSGAFFIDVNITSNILTSLPSASQLNRRVRVLDLSFNDISVTTNELRTLPNLEVLNVSENSLTSIGFLPDPCNLKILYANGNAISSLTGPLRKCSKLQILNIASNRLEFLSDAAFLGLTRLRVLDLSRNPLREVSPTTFQGLSQLESLFLNDCKLTTLPAAVFTGLDNMKMLFLTSNMLLNLPDAVFAGLSALEELSLISNQLQAIPASLSSDLRNLQFFWANFNNITSIQAGTFNNFLRLQLINLNGNFINYIAQGAFSNLPSLKVLLLDANRLTTLPNVIDCCNDLEDVSFEHNNITQPEETVVKRHLSTQSLQTSLKYNPIWPSTLRWMLQEAGYQFTVDSHDCACGAVQRGGAAVEICAAVECGRGNRYASWLAAVRGVAG